jgi:hypothetical protein
MRTNELMDFWLDEFQVEMLSKERDFTQRNSRNGTHHLRIVFHSQVHSSPGISARRLPGAAFPILSSYLN